MNKLALSLIPLLLLAPSAMCQSQRGVWDARTQGSRSTSRASTSGGSLSGGLTGRAVDGRQTTYGRNIIESIPSGGMQRRYMVHVPPTYNARAAYPVVLALHGSGMGMDSMRGLTLMDLTADRNNFIVVYPEGANGGWNAGGMKSKSSENDVAFIADLLRHLQTKYRVDKQAVYACGISNGGQMAERLACDLSDQIAAIGVVAITGLESICKSCSSRRTMPAMFFIGTDDPLCPRENGEAKQLGSLGASLGIGDIAITPQMAKFADIMTAEEVAEFWANHNGAGTAPRQERLPDKDTRDGCTVTREQYGGGDREVVVYTINGGGHSWPGGLGFVIEGKLGRTCMDVKASDLLWDFFRTHRRR